MMAGMETPTSGDILLRQTRINDVPANKRPTCMVFQSLALFPHRSVGENIEFAMKIREVEPAKRKSRALALLRQLRLPESYYSKSVQSARAASASASRLLAPSPTIPRSCSSTSRFRQSTTS